jgi:hypothetical protein
VGLVPVLEPLFIPVVLLFPLVPAVPAPVVLPTLLEPAVPVAAAPPPPAAPPVPCARAMEELIARTEAKAIVVSFMCFSSVRHDSTTSFP